MFSGTFWHKLIWYKIVSNRIFGSVNLPLKSMVFSLVQVLHTFSLWMWPVIIHTKRNVLWLEGHLERFLFGGITQIALSTFFFFKQKFLLIVPELGLIPSRRMIYFFCSFHHTTWKKKKKNCAHKLFTNFIYLFSFNSIVNFKVLGWRLGCCYCSIDHKRGVNKVISRSKNRSNSHKS